jgi:hypothetical protein
MLPSRLGGLWLSEGASGNFPGRNTIPLQGPPTGPFQQHHLLSGGPFSDAAARIFMRHHEIWGPAIGHGAGLSGVFGPVGAGPCRMVHMEFAELTFHALP